MINVIAGGGFISKTPKVAYALMEELASNNYQWTSKRAIPKQASRLIEIDHVSSINDQLAVLNKRFDNLERMNVSVVQSTIVCANCLGEYIMTQCHCGGVQTTKHIA